MLGFMNKKQAIAEGFTHHGSYYGIPVWIGDIDGDFNVCTKWAPMEHLMSVAHNIEAFLFTHFFPDREPAFVFKIGDRIETLTGC